MTALSARKDTYTMVLNDLYGSTLATAGETFAAIVASLPPVKRSSLQGIWLVTWSCNEQTEQVRAVFGEDGQYLETDSSFTQLGFGSWRQVGKNTFEVSFEKSAFRDTVCTGWVSVQSTITLLDNTASGYATWTTYNMDSPLHGSCVAQTYAERLDPALV